MFDLTSGKLLLLGIVALIVLGPKDFPILLRTIGKYMGIIKRQADEFREQFNEAIRESEFDQIKKDVEGLGQELDTTMRETQSSISKEMDSVTSEFDTVRHDIDAQLADPLKPSPHTDGYTPLGIEDQPAPTSSETSDAPPVAAADPDAHDANGMPLHGSDTPEPTRERAAAPAERALNGSGAHAETSHSTAEPTAKSGA
jgi:sec-independent protein translocase protein TatB